jgi:hypothetical protein
MSEGWRCPGCGKCYAPWVGECTTCGQPLTTETSGSITIITERCQCPYPLVIIETAGKHCGHCGKVIDDPWGWSLTGSAAGSQTVKIEGAVLSKSPTGTLSVLGGTGEESRAMGTAVG